MTRALVILGALVIGAVMIFAVAVQITESRIERDALEGRIDNINTSREIDNEVDQLTPADRLRELCQRLSACD